MSFLWTPSTLHLDSSSVFPTLENHLNVMSSVPMLLATSLLQAKNIGIVVTPGKKPPWKKPMEIWFGWWKFWKVRISFRDEPGDLTFGGVLFGGWMRGVEESQRFITGWFAKQNLQKFLQGFSQFQPYHTMHHKSYPKNWQQAHKEQMKLNKKSSQSDA